MAHGGPGAAEAALSAFTGVSGVFNERKRTDIAQQNANTFEDDLAERVRQNNIDLTNAAYDDFLAKYDKSSLELRTQLKVPVESRNKGRVAELREETTGFNTAMNILGAQLGKAEITLNPEFSPKAAAAEELAAGTAAGTASVTDVSAEANRMAKLALEAASKGLSPEDIGGVLNSMAARNPELQPIAEAIAAAMPSPTERGVNLGATVVAQAQPKIQALIAAGVDPELASLVALGEVSLTTDQGGPGGLSDIEARGLRDEIQIIRKARISLQGVIPLINSDSVGIMGSLNENFGGITSQLPGIKQIQNAIGIFDEKTVQEAIQARNAFRQTIEFLKPFATRKGTKLSNEDRNFITKLTGFLDVRQEEETVRGTAQRMLGIMTKLEGFAAKDLGRGAIELAPAGGDALAGRSEEDILNTMAIHNITREELARRLSAQ